MASTTASAFKITGRKNMARTSPRPLNLRLSIIDTKRLKNMISGTSMMMLNTDVVSTCLNVPWDRKA